MKAKRTWIVIVDAETARIVVSNGPGSGLYEIEAEGLAPEPVTRLSDEPGMNWAPAGYNRGAVSEPDLKTQAMTLFAKRILHFLDTALDRAAFAHLILVAPPKMLGILRQHITPALQSVLLADLPKDLKHVAVGDIGSHLQDVLKL